MTIYDLHRQRIFLTARNCLDSPFRHQGRNPIYGLDCVGLIIYVAKTLGLSDFDYLEYKRIPGRDAISHHVKAAGFKVRKAGHMTPGDAVILRFGKYIEHSAILSDRGIIHAYEKYGKVVEHGLDAHWRSRIISVHSFPDKYEGIK